MGETIELVVEASGDRLDKYLAEHMPLSRAHIQKLIRDGNVRVGGLEARPSRGITRGERITIALPPPEPLEAQPEPIPLSIVFEDADVLVIDKPAGLTVHPAPGHPHGTLVNAVLAHCPDLGGIKGTLRPGIVHRLDKDTSGLMMVAKSDAAQQHLSAQIKRREITKGYLALVHGHLSPRTGAIEGPIGRHPRDRKKMAIVSGGREARTLYEVREYCRDCTFIEVRPETGRTHQIRVHLASIGHPLVGDALYGKKSEFLSRHFLHAHRLGFRLTSTGEYKEFTSGLPADLRRALDTVRKGA